MKYSGEEIETKTPQINADWTRKIQLMVEIKEGFYLQCFKDRLAS